MKSWAALSETLSEDFDPPLSWNLEKKTCLAILEIQKPKMAQVVNFFTKPLFKNAKNQSSERG